MCIKSHSQWTIPSGCKTIFFAILTKEWNRSVISGKPCHLLQNIQNVVKCCSSSRRMSERDLIRANLRSYWWIWEEFHPRQGLDLLQLVRTPRTPRGGPWSQAGAETEEWGRGHRGKKKERKEENVIKQKKWASTVLIWLFQTKHKIDWKLSG